MAKLTREKIYYLSENTVYIDLLKTKPFLKNLWMMLGDEVNYDLLHWMPCGTQFAISKNHSKKWENLLSTHFRHKNIHSFKRQLNYFGIKKVDDSGDFVIYSNEFLNLYSPDKIICIKRKTCQQESHDEIIQKYKIADDSKEQVIEILEKPQITVLPPVKSKKRSISETHTKKADPKKSKLKHINESQKKIFNLGKGFDFTEVPEEMFLCAELKDRFNDRYYTDYDSVSDKSLNEIDLDKELSLLL
jgi:hypothetical protein